MFAQGLSPADSFPHRPKSTAHAGGQSRIWLYPQDGSFCGFVDSLTLHALDTRTVPAPSNIRFKMINSTVRDHDVSRMADR